MKIAYASVAAAFALFSGAALAVNPLTTEVLVRVGPDLHYFGACSGHSMTLEPGDASGSILNAPSCGSYWHTTTAAPPWTIDTLAKFGTVYLPDVTFYDCALIHSQIVADASVRLTITVECQTGSIFAAGFDEPRGE